jgi:hypothetical protein
LRHANLLGARQLPFVNSPQGGGRVGAVVLSNFVQPGTVVTAPYNHYSALRTIEDLFGLAYLGFAGEAGANSFGLDVFAFSSVTVDSVFRHRILRP